MEAFSEQISRASNAIHQSDTEIVNVDVIINTRSFSPSREETNAGNCQSLTSAHHQEREMALNLWAEDVSSAVHRSAPSHTSVARRLQHFSRRRSRSDLGSVNSCIKSGILLGTDSSESPASAAHPELPSQHLYR